MPRGGRRVPSAVPSSVRTNGTVVAQAGERARSANCSARVVLTPPCGDQGTPSCARRRCAKVLPDGDCPVRGAGTATQRGRSDPGGAGTGAVHATERLARGETSGRSPTTQNVPARGEPGAASVCPATVGSSPGATAGAGRADRAPQPDPGPDLDDHLRRRRPLSAGEAWSPGSRPASTQRRRSASPSGCAGPGSRQRSGAGPPAPRARAFGWNRDGTPRPAEFDCRVGLCVNADHLEPVSRRRTTDGCVSPTARENRPGSMGWFWVALNAWRHGADNFRPGSSRSTPV